MAIFPQKIKIRAAPALGGHVTLTTGGNWAFQPQFQVGKLRALAVSSPSRSLDAATPTLKEKVRRYRIR